MCFCSIHCAALVNQYKRVRIIPIRTCSYNFFNNDMMDIKFPFHTNNKFVGDTCILYHTNILIHPGPGYAGIF